MSVSHVVVHLVDMPQTGLIRWRIVVTTPSLKAFERWLLRASSSGSLSVFEARTMWKNERRLFRRLADVK